MLELILSPLSFILAFVFYIASSIIELKRLATFCRYIAFAIFTFTIIVWIISFNEKVNDSSRRYHKELMMSVTYHVEKLLKKGDYKNAEIILNRFNKNYWEHSYDNEGLEALVKSMDIPLYSRTKEAIEQLNKKTNEGRNSEQKN